jgi:NAD(P)-dependent dehydrogenase (short-subunit alcohol dehydrogenase family)
MKNKVCIVTGASSGIGKETARGLAALDATVVLACRDATRAEAAREEIVASTGSGTVSVLPLDLADIASIDRFVAAFRERFDRLDVLVDNAAGLWRRRTVTRSGLESTFAVNHLGHFALTLGLLDRLVQSAPARIVMVSSKLHVGAPFDVDDLLFERRRYGGFAAYNASKLANVIFTRAMARRLEGTGVTINALHPGEAATGIARDYGRLMTMTMRVIYPKPTKAARTPIFVATAPEIEGVSGRFFSAGTEAPYAPIADDVEIQERLWTESQRLLATAREAASAA